MSEKMDIDDVKYIIGSVMKYAYESVDEEKADPTTGKNHFLANEKL